MEELKEFADLIKNNDIEWLKAELPSFSDGLTAFVCYRLGLIAAHSLVQAIEKSREDNSPIDSSEYDTAAEKITYIVEYLNLREFGTDDPNMLRTNTGNSPITNWLNTNKG